MNFKKLVSSLLIGLFVIAQPVFALEGDMYIVDTFSGLWRSPGADKIPDGGHTRFQNAYIKDKNIRVVKGRDRLNSTALSNTTTNGFWYYENAAGTTKKLIRMENTVLASYDVDGTNRTQLNTGLTNEPHTAWQEKDILYITSDTDGLYKWNGSGAATAISGVAAPSTVDFSAATGAGGLTPGNPILVAAAISTDGACAISPSTSATGCFCLGGGGTIDCTSGNADTGGQDVTSDTGTLEAAGTTTTYSYKVTKYSSLLGLESEASTVDTATLNGDDHFTWNATNCQSCDGQSPYSDYDSACCTGIEYTTSGRQTSTTGTLASAPSAPFDGYRIYRTVANGKDYFLLGYQTTGTYTDGKPDVAMDAPFDSTIDTITPPSYRYIAGYKGSLFLAQGNAINFSRAPVQHPDIADTDTFWLKSDTISTSSKSPITGLKPTSDSLVVFTSSDISEITGFGAATFKLKSLVKDIGAVSSEAIETDGNGDIIFFAGSAGVYKLRTFQQPTTDVTGDSVEGKRFTIIKLSSPPLDEVFRGTDSEIDLDPANYAASHAYYDIDNDLYFLYIDQHCLIYDNVNNSWSYLPATKMTASVYRKSPGLLGQGVMTDNLGFMYNNWTGYDNGIESGTVTGSPTSSTDTTLTDSGATFNTTNDGLKGLWVAVDNQDGIQYRQISSNTGTALTVSSAWTTNPSTDDVYYIGYILFDITTKAYSPKSKAPSYFKGNNVWIMYDLPTTDQVVSVYSWRGKDSTIPTAAVNITLDNDEQEGFTQPLQLDLTMPNRSSYIQFGIRGFVYNISATVKPPINLTAYAFRAEEFEPR